METVVLDICGQICPSTLLIALREMNAHDKGLREGTVTLCFKTDNRDATVTIPESATNMGYNFQVERQQGCYFIKIGCSGEVKPG